MLIYERSFIKLNTCYPTYIEPSGFTDSIAFCRSLWNLHHEKDSAEIGSYDVYIKTSQTIYFVQFRIF